MYLWPCQYFTPNIFQRKSSFVFAKLYFTENKGHIIMCYVHLFNLFDKLNISDDHKPGMWDYEVIAEQVSSPISITCWIQAKMQRLHTQIYGFVCSCRYCTSLMNVFRTIHLYKWGEPNNWLSDAILLMYQRGCWWCTHSLMSTPSRHITPHQQPAH